VASEQLGTSENYRFALPVDIAESQAGDFPGTNAIHREQHQDRVIANGRQADRRPGGAPAPRFGVAEECSQR
jgi:hypothetical protein